MACKLTAEQQSLVVEHLMIVSNLIRYRIKRNRDKVDYDPDDLYQEGCIGLCRAAASYNGTTQFKTYAEVVVWRHLLDYCGKANARQTATAEIPANPVSEEQQLDMLLLRDAGQRLKGNARRGFDALVLRVDGYSTREIGLAYGVQPRRVRQWMADAVHCLRAS